MCAFAIGYSPKGKDVESINAVCHIATAAATGRWRVICSKQVAAQPASCANSGRDKRT